MKAEILILVITWLVLVAIQAMLPWLSRRNVLFGVVYARTSIWQRPEAVTLRRRYLVASLLGAVVIAVLAGGAVAIWALSSVTLAWIQIAATLATVSLNGVLIIDGHRKSKQLMQQLHADQALTNHQVTIDLASLKPQTLVPAAAGLVLLPQCLLAIFLGLRQPSADTIVLLMALGIETLILLTAFYLTRRARGTVRGNPDAEPRSGRVRNAILYYLLLIGFLSQSLLVLQLMLPAMSSDWQWLNVILTATLTLVSVMLLPMAYIAGTRKLDAKGKVLNDNQHWIGGVFYYNPGDPAIFVEKRIGIGFTLNMARPISWVLMGLTLVLILGIVLLAFWFD